MLIWVAEAGEIDVVEALRYAALSASAPSVYSPREVVELHVCVAPDSQRGGLGTCLVTRAESDFRERTSAAEIHVASVHHAGRGRHGQSGTIVGETSDTGGGEKEAVAW